MNLPHHEIIEDAAFRAVGEYVGSPPEQVDIALLREMRLALDDLWTRACRAQQRIAAE